jgi:serine/threonine protein kinase
MVALLAMAKTEGTVRERYLLVRKLGEGSQGCTFDAVDTTTGRHVAVKRFDVRGAARWKDVELAEREARVLASLSHPSLPAYVDHFEEGGALYLVMQKIEGESLAVWKAKGLPFGEKDALRLLRDASDALDYLHERTVPVIHRDLKPANVVRRDDGSFAFVDFGAVRERLTTDGGSTVVGTFGYMAPEQFQGRAGPSTDVYAVGATIVAMLAGQEPEKLPHAGLRVDARAALGGRVPDALVNVLERMLEPDPDKRPSQIAPLLRELGEAEASRTAPRSRATETASGPAHHGKDGAAPDPIPNLRRATESVPALVRAWKRVMPVLWVVVGTSWWWAPSTSARDFTIGLVVLTLVMRAATRRLDADERRARARKTERVIERAPAVRIDARTAAELDEADAEERFRGQGRS